MATVRKDEGPVRTCVGCRQRRPRDELVRLTREAHGAVVADVNGRSPGRGAYVCGEATCLERGLRRERLAHAFRASCRVTPELSESVAVLARERDAVTRASVE